MVTIKESFFFIFVMIIIAMFTIAFLLPQLPDLSGLEVEVKSHATISHVNDAEIVRNCLSRNTYKLFQNPLTNRIARICQVDNNTWGIQIVERINGKSEEVTSFLKNKMSKYEDIVRYLNNRGYILK